MRAMAGMDDRLKIEFLRGQAHECRMRAATADRHEAKHHWLDLAREYDRQADHMEKQIAPLARRTGTARGQRS